MLVVGFPRYSGKSCLGYAASQDLRERPIRARHYRSGATKDFCEGCNLRRQVCLAALALWPSRDSNSDRRDLESRASASWARRPCTLCEATGFRKLIQRRMIHPKVSHSYSQQFPQWALYCELQGVTTHQDGRGHARSKVAFSSLGATIPSVQGTTTLGSVWGASVVATPENTKGPDQC